MIHAHEKIAKDIKADTIFKQEVEDLEKKFAINKIKVENCYTTDYEMIKGNKNSDKLLWYKKQ